MKTIQVGPYKYRIVANDRVLALDSLAGRCDPNRLEIHLDRNTAPGVQRETLLHELIHAVMDLAGLSQELADEAEEMYVRRISPVLLDVLRRNPKLVQFLTVE